MLMFMLPIDVIDCISPQITTRLRLLIASVFVHDGIKIPSDYSSSSVGVVCRLSPRMKLGGEV